MLHATAAGAYWRDEIRVTNGSLSALGLASLRVAAGLARRVLTVTWWLPSADVASIALAGLDAAYGRRVVDPARLGDGFTCGASAACLVGPGDGPGAIWLDAFAFGQADYHRWLGGVGEPEELLRRVGRELADRTSGSCDDRGLLALAPLDTDAWQPLAEAVRIPASWRALATGGGHGHATGLVLLAAAAADLGEGERAVVCATGVPAFLQAEAIAVTRGPGA
jgi:hypothetical protein